ncbi:sirohydrochlorin chelatase [Kitasatospora sp. NPDC091335]|uniref:sirohydrochlorin chelatase n=1 Tax=Kitasatospora sp. NPDC091335 TaxID=3364085 RepID=UPI003806F49E
MAPVLLAVAHGSRDETASTSIRGLLRVVRSLRPQLTVHCCFLDLSRPSLDQTLARLAHRRPILVPLLLGTGYHLRVDLPTAPPPPRRGGRAPRWALTRPSPGWCCGATTRRGPPRRCGRRPAPDPPP